MNTVKTFFKNMGKGPAMVISLLAGLSLGLLIGGCMAHNGHRGYREYGEMRFQGNNQGYGYENQRGGGMMNTMWGMRNMMGNQNYGQRAVPPQNVSIQPGQVAPAAPATTTVGQ